MPFTHDEFNVSYAVPKDIDASHLAYEQIKQFVDYHRALPHGLSPYLQAIRDMHFPTPAYRVEAASRRVTCDLWRPGATRSMLPPAQPVDSGARVYFYDSTNKRATFVPIHLQGMRWVSTGPMIARRFPVVDTYVGGTTTEVVGLVRDLADETGRDSKVWRRVRVDARSFPGRRVRVLVYRGGGVAEWALLADAVGPDGPVVVRGRPPVYPYETWGPLWREGLVSW